MIMASSHYRCCQSHRNAWFAFTLVELLVVLAITGILFSLLVRGLTQAKALGTGAVCLNNLKQHQLAFLIYAGDNKERIPPNPSTFDAGRRCPSWVGGDVAYISAGNLYPTDMTHVDWLIGSGEGRISPYIRSAGVYRCPGDQQRLILDGNWISRVRTCAMNDFLDGGRDDPRNGVIGSLPSMRTPTPPELWVFIDVHDDSLGVPGFNPTPHQDGFYVDLPAARHRQSGTLSFADGHALLKRWSDPRTRRPVTGVYPGNDGDVGSTCNNRDILWLYFHATIPAPYFQP